MRCSTSPFGANDCVFEYTSRPIAWPPSEPRLRASPGIRSSSALVIEPALAQEKYNQAPCPPNCERRVDYAAQNRAEPVDIRTQYPTSRGRRCDRWRDQGGHLSGLSWFAGLYQRLSDLQGAQTGRAACRLPRPRADRLQDGRA